MKKLFQNNLFLSLLTGLGAFAVYCRTLAPSGGYEDAGELATAVHTLGITHPSGYPLWTFLGWMFSHLPLGDARVIWKLNLFGAVLTALATALFFRLFLFLLSDKAFLSRQAPAADSLRDSFANLYGNRIAAVTAALTFAFSRTYWSEAVSLEVYALHLVFLALVTWAFLAALSAQRLGPGRHADRLWLPFAFTLGLSFAHHMMTVLLAPAFLYLFFRVHGWGRVAWLRILKAVPPFLLPLTLYLYLPLRAAHKPVMNWGNPDSWMRVWEHVRAAQYKTQMFSSWEIAARKTLQFFADFPREFGYAPLLLVAVGLWVMARRRPEMLVFCLLIFSGCLFYAVNYAFDDPNFYLNAYGAVCVCIAFAVRALFMVVRPDARWAVALGCVAAAASPLVLNYPVLNARADYAIEDYTRNTLNSMDSGAVLFSNEYERMGSAAYYLQIVEGYRQDVVVLDIILLGNPWYYGQLEQRYPWLTRAAAREIAAYRRELEKYLAGTPDTAAHNRRLEDLFHAVIEKSRAAGRPVYVSSGINEAALEKYQRIPSGLVFRLEPGEERIPAPAFRDFTIRRLPSAEANRVAEKIRNDYAEGYANQGIYHAATGDTAMGIALLRKALRLQPAFQAAAAVLRDMEAVSRGPGPNFD